MLWYLTTTIHNLKLLLINTLHHLRNLLWFLCLQKMLSSERKINEIITPTRYGLVSYKNYRNISYCYLLNVMNYGWMEHKTKRLRLCCVIWFAFCQLIRNIIRNRNNFYKTSDSALTWVRHSLVFGLFFFVDIFSLQKLFSVQISKYEFWGVTVHWDEEKHSNR